VLLLWLFSCWRPMTLDQAFLATHNNDAKALARWLDAGGDPDAVLGDDSLLYVATGPKGGAEVLDLLLSRGADPELGSMGYIYSPIMNASSWCWHEGVKKLLEAGADPRPAVPVVCQGPGRETILSTLEAAIGPRR
jgi:hypothetical protein